MNKYFILIILGVLIIGGGIVYKTFLASEESAPVTTGSIREITIIAKENQWRFEPEAIEVERGDKLIFTVINEDDYDHGIAIDAFGVSQRMPAKSDPKTKGIIKFEFVATQAGEFPFYCSVPCGEGEVDGAKRTHFDMVGKIKVKDIVGVSTKTGSEAPTTYRHPIGFSMQLPPGASIETLEYGRVELAEDQLLLRINNADQFRIYIFANPKKLPFPVWEKEAMGGMDIAVRISTTTLGTYPAYRILGGAGGDTAVHTYVLEHGNKIIEFVEETQPEEQWPSEVEKEILASIKLE